MFNFDKYMGSGIMVFDKDTKIRGDDLDESYTLYNIENGAHLFYSLRLDDYAWEYMGDGDIQQLFSNDEIDFLITIIQSLVEIADATPWATSKDISEEISIKYSLGGRMKEVVKVVIDTGYQKIRIIPGKSKVSHFGETGEVITTWVPDFINEIRI